jgi:maleate isomerase
MNHPASQTESSVRVGLIVPSSNTVMEPDFHRRLGDIAIVSTTRIFLEDVTRDAETRMLEQDLPRAIDLIRTTAPDIVVFGCTSAGALGNSAHDQAIAGLIAAGTGAVPITVLASVLNAIRAVAPRRLALFTLYVDDLTGAIASSLKEAGFPPVKAAGMGIRSNLEIGRVPPPEIIRFVESQLAACAPDCLFLSCTNWQAIDAIEPLEQKLGVPILTSNQAAIHAVTERRKHTREFSQLHSG